MKANFKVSKSTKTNKTSAKKNDSEISPQEFEDFIIRSGAAGSFMIFRSRKKEDELGIDEL